jgi:ABC-type dipeptide/oligopeptide/nickel transport system permease component
MNWECVRMEGLRMRTGLKLVIYSKCSGLAGSALPDHTSSFFLLISIKAPVFCLGFAVCLLWLMLHRVFSFVCMRTERWVDSLWSKVPNLCHCMSIAMKDR